MDGARIALAALATLGSGIALGLAVDPTMRTFPEADWRARYRLANPAPPPAPQPGVSYFDDSAPAGAYGWAQPRVAYDAGAAQAVRYQPLGEEPGHWVPPPSPDVPPPYPGPDDYDAQASATERAAAQAAVSAALIRSAPREDSAAEWKQMAASADEPAEDSPGG